MEDILGVYLREYNLKRPVVCMDESSKQQVEEVKEELPMKKGSTRKYDSEYIRNGVSNLFMMFEPLKGWRKVKVTDTRTAIDFAYCIKDLVDVHYKKAEKIVLVLDNLNTHGIASLYKAFTPEEAYRLAEKLEIHYTPKHGSWLNMAEIEFSALSKQCLNRRIGTQEKLIKEIGSWERERNKGKVKCIWQFTVEKARRKLHKLYPILKQAN